MWRKTVIDHLTLFFFNSCSRGLHTFSVKGQTVNILPSAGHTASVATPQLCWHSTKAAIDKTEANELAVRQSAFVYEHWTVIHLTFMCHKINSNLLDFFYHLKVWKTILCLWTCTKTRLQAHSGPWATVCSPLKERYIYLCCRKTNITAAGPLTEIAQPSQHRSFNNGLS